MLRAISSRSVDQAKSRRRREHVTSCAVVAIIRAPPSCSGCPIETSWPTRRKAYRPNTACQGETPEFHTRASRGPRGLSVSRWPPRQRGGPRSSPPCREWPRRPRRTGPNGSAGWCGGRSTGCARCGRRPCQSGRRGRSNGGGRAVIGSPRWVDGGRPISNKRLGEYFKSAAERTGITGFTLHDLRHFFKSFCVNSRVPERAVDQWLGHSDGSVRGIYYHLTDVESERFMDSVPFGKEPVVGDDDGDQDGAHKKRKGDR